MTNLSPKEKDESSENAKTDEDTKKREEVSDMDGRKKKVARRRLPAKAGVHIDEQVPMIFPFVNKLIY